MGCVQPTLVPLVYDDLQSEWHDSHMEAERLWTEHMREVSEAPIRRRRTTAKKLRAQKRRRPKGISSP